VSTVSPVTRAPVGDRAVGDQDRSDDDHGEVTIEQHWRDLVTVALLGTDRRDPPPAPGPIADVVADTVRSSPSERMLAQVAASTAVRRAGVLPGPVIDELATPERDDRPPCPPAAVDRWHHITTSWPVLEDEWLLTLIAAGWRIAPELLPSMLLRHRADAVRRTRVMVGAGPAGRWLVGHVPDLAPRHPNATVTPEALRELPELPIAPELAQMLDWPGAETGAVLGQSIESAALGPAHKAMLVNMVARVRVGALVDLAEVLSSVDSMSPGHGLASVLADAAITRHRMLEELTRT
jgi:hypothetical protein